MEHYFTEKPKSKLRMGLVKARLRSLEFEFLTASGVFSNKRIDPGTRLLIESMILPEKGTFLDLGCGYGPIGIVAARLRPKARVYMTDVNRRAINLADDNARRNSVMNIKVLEGPLYEPVSKLLFEVILTNPPITAGIKKTVAPIIRGAARHLKEEGSLQLVVRTKKGGGNILKLIEKSFNRWEVIAKGGGYRVLMAKF